MTAAMLEPAVEPARDIPSYDEALAWVFDRINYERVPHEQYTVNDFKLERTRRLLAALGDPQRDIPAVHIAGTKGKGSTAAMLASVFQAGGYRSGLFTSPHVHRYEERMTVNGAMPAPGEFAELVSTVRRAADALERETPDLSPTYFEVTTAIAWLYFLRRDVDVVVLETGLGGRLDATNVCRPLVTVITSISRDHVRLLGNTLSEIAREKAGIIKPGVPVVSGANEAEAAPVIAGFAAARGAPLFQLGRDVRAVRQGLDRDNRSMLPQARIDVEFSGRRRREVRVPLPGEHQARNTALVLASLDLLAERGFAVSSDAVRDGLRRMRWPLRIEVLRTRPLVIADAAHNDASIEALLDTLQATPAGRRVLIFASSRDKDAADMLRRLDRGFDHFILTRYVHNPRAIPLEDLATVAAEVLTRPFETAPSPQAAWDRAQTVAGPGDLICATGSFFLASEVREIVLSDRSARGSRAK
jgi:dihydrofolate synthase/folylpolyglutamate synthase